MDFLLQNSGDRVNLEMDFFGGEPLMNFETVKKIVEYARSQEPVYHKKFRFTITTNGMLLTDDKIDFINREMSNVVLSIDGRKEVNDRMRPRVDGKGSYDKIIPMYKKLVDQRGERNTMSAVLTPSTIWTSPMMCSLCWTQASTRSLWNRLSLMRKNLTQLPRQTCPAFLRNMNG